MIIQRSHSIIYLGLSPVVSIRTSRRWTPLTWGELLPLTYIYIYKPGIIVSRSRRNGIAFSIDGSFGKRLIIAQLEDISRDTEYRTRVTQTTISLSRGCWEVVAQLVQLQSAVAMCSSESTPTI